jgi:hypothetical protein
MRQQLPALHLLAKPLSITPRSGEQFFPKPQVKVIASVSLQSLAVHFPAAA